MAQAPRPCHAPRPPTPALHLSLSRSNFFAVKGLRRPTWGIPWPEWCGRQLGRDEFFRKHSLPAGPSTDYSDAWQPPRRIGPPPAGSAGRRGSDPEGPGRQVFYCRHRRPPGPRYFRERIGSAPIQVIEGENWDAMAHADLVLAASGTVTIEAALLGTPMVTFYRVTPASWMVGRPLVNVPFYSMVNLVAGRADRPGIDAERK